MTSPQYKIQEGLFYILNSLQMHMSVFFFVNIVIIIINALAILALTRYRRNGASSDQRASDDNKLCVSPKSRRKWAKLNTGHWQSAKVKSLKKDMMNGGPHNLIRRPSNLPLNHSPPPPRPQTKQKEHADDDDEDIANCATLDDVTWLSDHEEYSRRSPVALDHANLAVTGHHRNQFSKHAVDKQSHRWGANEHVDTVSMRREDCAKFHPTSANHGQCSFGSCTKIPSANSSLSNVNCTGSYQPVSSEHLLFGVNRSDVNLKRNSWISLSADCQGNGDNYAIRQDKYRSWHSRVSELIAEINRQDQMNEDIKREAEILLRAKSSLYRRKKMKPKGFRDNTDSVQPIRHWIKRNWWKRRILTNENPERANPTRYYRQKETTQTTCRLSGSRGKIYNASETVSIANPNYKLDRDDCQKRASVCAPRLSKKPLRCKDSAGSVPCVKRTTGPRAAVSEPDHSSPAKRSHQSKQDPPQPSLKSPKNVFYLGKARKNAVRKKVLVKNTKDDRLTKPSSSLHCFPSLSFLSHLPTNITTCLDKASSHTHMSMGDCGRGQTFDDYQASDQETANVLSEDHKCLGVVTSTSLLNDNLESESYNRLSLSTDKNSFRQNQVGQEVTRVINNVLFNNESNSSLSNTKLSSSRSKSILQTEIHPTRYLNTDDDAAATALLSFGSKMPEADNGSRSVTNHPGSVLHGQIVTGLTEGSSNSLSDRCYSQEQAKIEQTDHHNSQSTTRHSRINVFSPHYYLRRNPVQSEKYRPCHPDRDKVTSTSSNRLASSHFLLKKY